MLELSKRGRSMILLGAGKSASRHYAALRRIGYVNEIYAYDPSPLALMQFGERHPIKSIDNENAALSIAKQHGAIICSIPYAHIEMAKRMLENDIDFVVEKPIVTKSEDLDAIQRGQRYSRSISAVVSQHLFSSAVKQFISFADVRETEIYAITLRSFRKKKSLAREERQWKKTRLMAGGGVLITTGIHYLDILTRIVGRLEVVSINHVVWAGEIETKLSMEARAVNGADVAVDVSWEEKRTEDLDEIVINLVNGSEAILRNGIFQCYEREEMIELHGKQMAEFLQCRRTRQMPSVNIDTAYITLAFIFDVYSKMASPR